MDLQCNFSFWDALMLEKLYTSVILETEKPEAPAMLRFMLLLNLF